MKINSSNVAMQSEHRLRRIRLERQTVSFTQTRISGSTPVREDENPQDTLAAIREKTMSYILDLLFGVYRGSDFFQKMRDDTFGFSFGGWQVNTTEITREVYYREEEDTAFTSQGTVKTADGRTIPFDFSVQMSRNFETYFGENFVSRTISTEMVDPLVINLDSAPASLSDQTFFFDLDADGKEEEISRLRSGSGYLALDHNGDGKINDGSELFGTSSGDGFADLAKYDEDGNGWIDENDSIFEKLKIWVQNGDGTESLYTLKQKNVGAICLGKVRTDFSHNSLKNNEVKGAVRYTGMFLFEDGAAGSVQHLDLKN